MDILVAIVVNEDGYGEVLRISEGMKKDRSVGSASSNGSIVAA